MKSVFTTWRNLLVPNGRDTRISLLRVDETGGHRPPQTSTFNPPVWHHNRLPSRVYLVRALPFKMHQDLRRILRERCADRAAATQFILYGRSYTPDDVLSNLRKECKNITFPVNYESGAESIAGAVSRLVGDIYYALMDELPMFARQQRIEHNTVITDFSYKLDNQVKILWEEKSPRVFDEFVEKLVGQISGRGLSGRDLYPETSATPYRGYRAILGKLSYHGMSIQPQVRWAVVFSGLKYIVIYIPRLPERPRLYCSPIMRFCLQLGDPEPAGQALPPIWSMLVYMLLTETFNISDDTLKQQLSVPVPSGDSGGTASLPLRRSKILRTINGAGEGQRHSGNLAEVGIAHGADGSLQAPGAMVVQCFDGLPMALSPVGTPQSSGGEKQHPFVHLDCYLGGGWSSVYASSRSHVIVKFATVPKKERAELERQLRNEKAAYDKLTLLTRLVVPLCYGEYVWYGGRALVLSDEGQSLAALGMEFASLELVERCDSPQFKENSADFM
ncbi:hypothetical protein BJV78DRAFT_1279691 [Lactifluus subvellereus]|nr:hypothetical protein BJV78DRAFT_1279691 [Lactifluus subvellereus]